MAKIDHISYGGTSYEIVPAAGDLKDIVAPEFSDQSSYTSGSYVLKNGVLYRFTQAHSGAWTGTDAETVTVGGEVTDLKADLQGLSNCSISADGSTLIINTELVDGNEVSY